jgi:catechol 2,3-dioxygenase-like lactoylglutathione lyase family enzyme
MIGYVTVGTNDIKKAGDFYDKICGELGMGRFMANDRLIAWGGPGGGAGFGVALPYDGKPMTIGNGVMAAFGGERQSPGRSGLQARFVAWWQLRGPSGTAQ